MANGHIIKWAEGNPGAMNFLEEVLYHEKMNFIVPKLTKFDSIRGTSLWILYSDLCEKNMDKVVSLLNNCPQNILEDACNRQDRSGRKLVSKYIS